MKIENAIQKIESLFCGFSSVASEEATESLKIAVAAMEKQVPARPVYHGCCSCGHDLGLSYLTPDYCPTCGQKIDWSKESDEGEEY